MDKHGAITLQSWQLTFDRSWTQAACKNWKVITALLQDYLQLNDMVSGPLDLVIPRQNWQTNAENQIWDLVNICRFPPSQATDSKTWASDGSMTPASASMMDDKTITGAATETRTLVMQIPGHNVSILHGEQLGLIIALILSQAPTTSQPANSPKADRLLTDHLNSVWLIEDGQTKVSQGPRLWYMNGQSYYWWILSLVEWSTLKICYTPGHSKDNTLKTHMNSEADHLATSSQKIFWEIPEAPSPTFHMNDFMFHHITDGWIESNIPHYVNALMTQQTQTALGYSHSQWMSMWAHDKTPPPDYLYLKVTSAHLAVVQLYAWLGQLATADTLRQQKKIDNDICWLGCDETESARHLFIKCQHYQQWQDKTSKQVVKKTRLKVETIGCGEATRDNLVSAAKLLFVDDPEIWPLHYSLYYLGQIPSLKQLITNPNISLIPWQHLESHITTNWHFSSKWLAGRIFSNFQKWMAVLNNCPNQKSETSFVHTFLTTEEHGLCYGVKRGNASRSGTTQNPQTPTPNPHQSK